MKLKDACSWKKSNDIPIDSIKKQRHYFAYKGHVTKTMVFPVVMYWCESWTVKKAECWRAYAFELWCWKRLLRASWITKIYDQSILKKINPEYSLEGLMLKLKLQHFDHLMWRTNSLEKRLMLGKIEGKRRRGNRMKWLGIITDSVDMNLNKLWETVKERRAWPTAVQWMQRLSNWA